VERLRPRGQAAEDDGPGNGVPAAFLPTRVAQGLCPDPPLRISVKPASRVPIALMPAVVGDEHASTAGIAKPRGKFIHLALPTLRRGHGRSTKAHRRGSLAVRLLRFVIAPRRVTAHRRARGTPAESCVRFPPAASGTALMARFQSTAPSPPSRREAHSRHRGDDRHVRHQAWPYQSSLQSP
jgi:hypothetical protein